MTRRLHLSEVDARSRRSFLWAASPTSLSVAPKCRLSGCPQLPLVLVGGLSYEPVSDTVVVATMGRGVYILPAASQLVVAALRP